MPSIFEEEEAKDFFSGSADAVDENLKFVFDKSSVSGSKKSGSKKVVESLTKGKNKMLLPEPSVDYMVAELYRNPSDGKLLNSVQRALNDNYQ